MSLAVEKNLNSLKSMVISKHYALKVSLLVLFFSAPALLFGATISSQVTAGAGFFLYEYQIQPSGSDAPDNPVIQWMLPLVNGDDFDVTTGQVTTPEFWSAQLHQTPFSQWEYTALNDPYQYGLSAADFESSKWILRFVLDLDARDLRMTEINDQIIQLKNETQVDFIKLQSLISKRNNILEIVAHMDPNNPLYAELSRQLGGIDSQIADLQQALNATAGHLSELETELAELNSSTYTGFSFVSPLGPVSGPAQLGFLDDTNLFPAIQVPVTSLSSVPVPGTITLLSFGLLVLSGIRRTHRI
ncbi:MAG: hypothetical protein HUN04_01465 [Desulfobacter sp.]|nr:MAG: hypothetical protein HUN04_01465 [Desulfobacter sp.]